MFWFLVLITSDLDRTFGNIFKTLNDPSCCPFDAGILFLFSHELLSLLCYVEFSTGSLL